MKKIISGCQTGADIVAIDAAIALNFPYGGWVPKRAKDVGRTSPGTMSICLRKSHRERLKVLLYPCCVATPVSRKMNGILGRWKG